MAIAAASKYPVVNIDTGGHTPIAEDEVVFTLRAQDALAAPAVEAYYELCVAAGCPPAHQDAIQVSIREIKEWQRAHPELVGIPD